METLKRTRINIHSYEDGVIKLFRNGRPELKIFAGSKELERYLVQLLHKEHDYDSYMGHINFKNGEHLSSWLFDVLTRDLERELANLLQGTIVRPLNMLV